MVPESERPDADEASEILSACAALPLTERSAFLDTRCAGRPTLRSEVEELLSFLHDPEFEEGDERDDETARARRRVGSEIGGCRLVELLAMGGMGAVYRAEQESPRREVALKLLRPDGLGTDAWRRLKREALVLGRLDHPAIARVFTAGIHRDAHGATPYLIMELVEGGRPMSDWWRQRDLPLARRIALFATVCEAIHHGHIKGVLHRDVKPGNLLVDREDRPKVIDFGIARMLEPGSDDENAPATEGRVIGTIAYMAPERLDGSQAIDVRSDVYGLGIVLYELLTGRLPFGRPNGSIAATATAIALGQVAPPSSVDRRCRGDLDAIVAKAMSADPADRYDSASALAADLRSHLENRPIQAEGVGRVTRIRKFLLRNWIVTASLVAVIASLAIGLAVSLRATSRAELALYLSLLSQGELTIARQEIPRTLKILDQIGPERQGEWPVRVLRGYTNDVIESARLMDSSPVRLRLDKRRERLLASGDRDRAELVVLGTSPASIVGRIPLPSAGLAADWGACGPAGSGTVLAGLADGRILEIQVADGALLRELGRIDHPDPRQGPGRISDVALDPSGRWLAIGHSSDVIRLLDMSDGTFRDLRGFGNPTIPSRISVEWSPGGGVLAVAASRGTFIFDADLGLQRQLSSLACNHAVFSPDGKRIATALAEGGTEVIEVETASSRSLSPAAWPIFGVDWSPDGGKIAIIGRSHWVIVCDASSGARTTLKSDIDSGLGVRWFTESEFCTIPEGRVFSLRYPPARMYPLSRRTTDSSHRELRVGFLDGGQSMVCTGPEGRIDLIDPLLRTRTEISRVPVQTPSTDRTPDSETVALVDGIEPGPLWIVRPREGTTRRIEGSFRGPAAISADGKRVVACGPGGEALVVDVSSGRIEHRQEHSVEATTSAFIWLDEERILWCLSKGGASLSRDSDGLWSFRLDQASAAEEAWSVGNGKWYWKDRTQRLKWSATNRIGDRAARDLRLQAGRVLCVAAHPLIHLVAFGDSEGRIVVIDESIGAQVATFHEFSRRFTDLAWSPDGSMLAAVDANGCITFFDSKTNSERWPEIAQRLSEGAESTSESRDSPTDAVPSSPP